MRGTVVRPWSLLLAVLAIGCLFPACGAQSPSDTATGTVNLTSLPAAEVWIDGKAAGTTPVTVSLVAGPHEVVLKQAGFAEHRETVEVASGSVRTIDAGLLVVDAGDPDAVRQLASAFGITVEPFRAPEISRGAPSDRGITLMFPRNDIRKEGLTSFRIDVTPAYDATGFLEFRKGKTSLLRRKFEPETLVNTVEIPSEVIASLKVGDTVTWGVWYDDSRKPVTAQFEIVNKPVVTRKLTELSEDTRLARQPAAIRQQLEAEVLQNYRLYSEALVRLLDLRYADKDNLVPLTGIVSCLRRLELEDTGLFNESATMAVGQLPKGRKPKRTGADVATGLPGVSGPKPANLPPVSGGAGAPPAAGSTAPTGPAPVTPDTAEGTTPTDPAADRHPTDPATGQPTDPAAGQPTDPAAPEPRDPAAGGQPTDPAANQPRDPSASQQPTDPATGQPANPATGKQQTDPATGRKPTDPAAAGKPPAPGAPPQPFGEAQTAEAMKSLIATATEHAKVARSAADEARAAADQAEAAARAAPEDPQARAKADELRLKADSAAQGALDAQQTLEALKRKSGGTR